MDYRERKATLARVLVALKDKKKKEIAFALHLTPSDFGKMLHGETPMDNVTFKTLLDILELDESTKEKILLSTGL